MWYHTSMPARLFRLTQVTLRTVERLISIKNKCTCTQKLTLTLGGGIWPKSSEGVNDFGCLSFLG